MPVLEVLFVIRTLQFGGAERQLVELVRGLHSHGRRVTVLTLYDGGPLAAELVSAGVPLVSLAKRGRWDWLGPLGRAVRLIRRERPAILHGYLPSGNLLVLGLRWLSPGSRVVWGIRGTMLDLERYDRFTGFTYRLLCRLSRWTDLVISNSAAGAADHVAAGFPADRMHVVPNGIDTVRFRPDPALRAETRKAWGVAESDPVVGIVARLDPQKDHATFLRAAAILSATLPQVRFVVAGNGTDRMRAALQQLARELGIGDRIHWLPAQLDPARVYNGLDLHCSASRFGEGFSNALAEALACGVPSVATEVGDAREVLGDLGRVVPPGDPTRLAEALRSGLAERSPELSRRCRRRVTERFSVERLVERTAAALDTLSWPAA